MSKLYTVVWRMELHADDARDAAGQAFACIADGDARVFDVYGDDGSVDIVDVDNREDFSGMDPREKVVVTLDCYYRNVKSIVSPPYVKVEIQEE